MLFSNSAFYPISYLPLGVLSFFFFFNLLGFFEAVRLKSEWSLDDG